MADKHVVEPTIMDVSERYPDLEPGVRVFRSVAGYLVRVQTLRRPSEDPGVIHFSLTGFLCDDTGATKVVNGVPRQGAPHVLTVQAHAPADVAGDVRKARELVVRRMELAALHHAAAAAIEGVA